FEYRPDGGVGQTVLHCINGELLILESVQSRRCAQPEIARSVLADRSHVVVREPFSDREGGEPVLAQSRHAAGGTDPQTAFRVLKQKLNDIAPDLARVLAVEYFESHA